MTTVLGIETSCAETVATAAPGANPASSATIETVPTRENNRRSLLVPIVFLRLFRHPLLQVDP
jgi:hypothetical protein